MSNKDQVGRAVYRDTVERMIRLSTDEGLEKEMKAIDELYPTEDLTHILHGVLRKKSMGDSSDYNSILEDVETYTTMYAIKSMMDIEGSLKFREELVSKGLSETYVVGSALEGGPLRMWKLFTFIRLVEMYAIASDPNFNPVEFEKNLKTQISENMGKLGDWEL